MQFGGGVMHARELFPGPLTPARLRAVVGLVREHLDWTRRALVGAKQDAITTAERNTDNRSIVLEPLTIELMPWRTFLDFAEDQSSPLHQSLAGQMPQWDGIGLEGLPPGFFIDLIEIDFIDIRLRLGFCFPQRGTGRQPLASVALVGLTAMTKPAFASMPTRKGLLSRHGGELSSEWLEAC
jgi:hypothetical protein